MLNDIEYKTLINLIESINPSQFKGLTTKIKYLYPSIYNKLLSRKINQNISKLSECIYLEINKMEEIPLCCKLSKKCKNRLKFKSILEGYFPYCKACSSKNEDFISRRKETNIFRYGTEFPTKNIEILNKIKNTNLLRYNVENVKQIIK